VMSVLCKKETRAAQRTTRLFDHLIGAPD